MKKLFDMMEEITSLLRQQSIQQNEILSFDNACDFLGFKPSYLYKLTSSAEIPCYTPTGRKLFFKRSELIEWTLRHRKSTQEELVQQSFQLIKPKRKHEKTKTRV